MFIAVEPQMDGRLGGNRSCMGVMCVWGVCVCVGGGGGRGRLEIRLVRAWLGFCLYKVVAAAVVLRGAARPAGAAAERRLAEDDW